MSSDSRPPVVRTNNVAARIQAFQRAEAVERGSSASVHRRIMTLSPESGTFASRGRRKDDSFASPAGRASRDGNEGVRGDGRPPVADASPSIHPATQETELFAKLRSRLVPRSQTSSGETPNKVGDVRMRLKSVVLEKNDEDEALSKTEPVATKPGEPQESNTGKVRITRHDTLGELGDLIDDAIEEAVKHQAPEPAERTLPERPRRWKSVNPPHRRSSQPPTARRAQSVARRQDNERIGSRSSNESVRPDRHRTVNDDKRLENVHVRGESAAHPAELKVPRTKAATKGPSPVKDRAARFERMQRRASSPKAVHTPPISLALPRLLSPRPGSRMSPRSSHGSEEDYTTAHQSKTSSRPATATLAASPERRGSSLWPFSLGLSNQSPAAKAPHTDVEVPAVPERIEHRASKIVMRSRVQDLVAAANKSEHTYGVTQGGKHHSRQPRMETTFREKLVPMPQEHQHEQEPKLESSLWPSASEKEVIRDVPAASACSHSHSPVSHSHSPVKRDPSTPSTPVRGRRGPESQTPGGSTYRVEQHFALSRSQSRGGAVRVQVEVRTSPERASEDAIVVVRADVEPMRTELEDE